MVALRKCRDCGIEANTFEELGDTLESIGRMYKYLGGVILEH